MVATIFLANEMSCTVSVLHLQFEDISLSLSLSRSPNNQFPQD